LNLLKEYIQNFIARAGSYILISSIFARLLSFLASWIALQLIPNKELGIVLFAYNIIVFIIPIGGLGLHQSLVRFGALLTTRNDRDNLFRVTFFKGIYVTFLLIILITISSLFIDFQFKNTRYYLIFLSFLLIPMYIFELVKVHFRLLHKNKLFATTEIIYAVTLTISVLLLSYFFKEKGYAIALVLTPSLTVLYFSKKIQSFLKIKKLPSKINLEFWRYGFFASLSNVVTQLLFVIDILLIGFILNNAEMVTNYKYVSLIPLSLLFLPRAFINTDFVTFTENIHDKNYIHKYIKSYVLFFSIVSILICVLLILLSKQILHVFDSAFVQFSDSFIILTIGICGILILRGLFGNLISSIGKAHVNFYITFFALLLNLGSNFYLIPLYGIKGAAFTSTLIMWITGIISAIVFWQLYNKRFLTNK
jgi:O-antigen/teichoic acid export membrane protein